jgi:hypothetical protein
LNSVLHYKIYSIFFTDFRHSSSVWLQKKHLCTKSQLGVAEIIKHPWWKHHIWVEQYSNNICTGNSWMWIFLFFTILNICELNAVEVFLWRDDVGKLLVLLLLWIF